jgi:quercetin dioxygenase-like cupin family protein
VGFSTVDPEALTWVTRPHEQGEPARHVAELSEDLGLQHARANLWRYEPGATGRRHRHPLQEEVFVVLTGTLTVYLGDPPRRVDVPAGGLVRVEPGTALQTANHGDDELVVYAHGWPPESERAEILDPVV